MLTVEKLRKEIKDNQYMKEGCAKMAHGATSFSQLITASKGHMMHSKRVELYTEMLKMRLGENSPPGSTECLSQSTATLRIQALRMPLLWTEEAKKKESSAGCAFFAVKYMEKLVDSDVIDFDSTFCELFCPNIKIAYVSIDDTIEIIAYNMWYAPGAYSKPLHKSKEEFGDPCLKFTELGRAIINLRDVVAQPEPYYFFAFNITDKNSFNSLNNTGHLKPDTPTLNISRTLGKLSLNKKTKEMLNFAFFGTRLHFWNIASGIFTFYPKNLESFYIKFNCYVYVNGLEKIMCVVFQGTNMNIYNHENIYMCHPSKSLYIPSLKIQESDDSSWVSLLDPEDNKPVTIKFENKKLALDFTSYFDTYKIEIELWGKSVDTQMEDKTACHAIIDIVTQKDILTSYLELTPMQIGFRASSNSRTSNSIPVLRASH